MARKSKPYKSSLQHGAGGERRGNVNFRVHMDDRQLMNKLKRLGAEGQDELRKLINEMMQKARVQSQEFLLDQKIHDRGTRGPTARSVQNVMTPKGDKNVYVQIAKSLKISDDALFVLAVLVLSTTLRTYQVSSTALFIGMLKPASREAIPENQKEEQQQRAMYHIGLRLAICETSNTLVSKRWTS